MDLKKCNLQLQDGFDIWYPPSWLRTPFPRPESELKVLAKVRVDVPFKPISVGYAGSFASHTGEQGH